MTDLARSLPDAVEASILKHSVDLVMATRFSALEELVKESITMFARVVDSQIGTVKQQMHDFNNRV